jgi:hypothetical protein
MTCEKWLVVSGGLLLLAGLLTALISNHLQARVMGQANLGVGVWAPEEGGEAWKQKVRLRARADGWFWIGIALTACGVVLQTLGAELPLTR